jgi:hypothetical protein
VDALFTATSATCVTGLIVFDTGSYFSLFWAIGYSFVDSDWRLGDHDDIHCLCFDYGAKAHPED